MSLWRWRESVVGVEVTSQQQENKTRGGEKSCWTRTQSAQGEYRARQGDYPAAETGDRKKEQRLLDTAPVSAGRVPPTYRNHR